MKVSWEFTLLWMQKAAINMACVRVPKQTREKGFSENKQVASVTNQPKEMPENVRTVLLKGVRSSITQFRCP